MSTIDPSRKVALIVGQLTFGGAERQLQELAFGLRRVGVDLVVVCLSDQLEPFGRILEKSDIEIIVIQRRGHFDFRRVLELRSLLRRRKLQWVHTFLFEANIYGYLASRSIPGTKLITTIRSIEVPAGALRNQMLGMALRGSDRIIANSRAASLFGRNRYRVPEGKIRVVFNGIDPQRFECLKNRNRIRSRLGIPPNGLVVGTVGRMSPVKNYPKLLKAAAALGKSRRDLRFLFVGGGSLLQKYQTFAEDLGIQDIVRFVGERNDVPEWLSAMDVFVLVSERESFPNVILEAMAAGKPVLSTRVGGCEEIIEDGVSGILVPPEGMGPLIDSLQVLLDDRELRESLGRAARRRVESSFSIPRMVRETIEVYETLGFPSGMIYQSA